MCNTESFVRLLLMLPAMPSEMYPASGSLLCMSKGSTAMELLSRCADSRVHKPTPTAIASSRPIVVTKGERFLMRLVARTVEWEMTPHSFVFLEVNNGFACSDGGSKGDSRYFGTRRAPISPTKRFVRLPRPDWPCINFAYSPDPQRQRHELP